MTKKHHIYRSSITGEIVTRDFAEANPATTTCETVIVDDTHGAEPIVSPADAEQQ